MNGLQNAAAWARAARLESDLAQRVRRYEEALLVLLRHRPGAMHEEPITPQEHLIAGQLAAMVADYERTMRRTSVPPPPSEAPPAASPSPKRGRRSRATGRPRGRPRKAAASPA